MEHIDEIIQMLQQKAILPANTTAAAFKSGTTNGILYLLHVDGVPAYVMKFDAATIIKPTYEFLTTYHTVELLPTVIYSDPLNRFILYTYIAGETHTHRGAKKDWMTGVIQHLFHHYVRVDDATAWGRVGDDASPSWSAFNESSLHYAQQNIGTVLPPEDHQSVVQLVKRLAQYELPEKKYYLHGDMGVHNFVYLNEQLVGIIDPAPLIGPKLYDFTYAFCSSPDALDFDTLRALFALWNKEQHYTEERLFEEVTFQLYTRIGICIKAHPHDLPNYLAAWAHYKTFLPR